MKYSWLALCIIFSACAISGKEPLEKRLSAGQTRSNILLCLGPADAYIERDGKETWLYGLTPEDFITYKDNRGRFNQTKVRKNNCRLDVVFGEIFAETYQIHNKSRGVFGTSPCYDFINQCAAK